MNGTDLLINMYEAVFENLDVGVHIIDKDGVTVVYNQKAVEAESMAREEVLHKDFRDVFEFEKNDHSTLVAALKSGKVTRHRKQTFYNNKGTEITTINDTFPIEQDGVIIGAVELSKDVTRLETVIKQNISKTKPKTYTFADMIGDSERLHLVIEEAKRATRTSSSVLITGETGTGKEIIAQSIHYESTRSSKPFISQNCAAIPATLMESLLFGTQKGAFTGAMDQPGLFEMANGGTLFLDELNSLDLSLQAKLLRVLQERKVRRVGGMTEKEVDVRVIATMNEDPIEAVVHERLRKDLYYRLSVVMLHIPPLRDRKEDLLVLTNHFIQKYNGLFGVTIERIHSDVHTVFEQHSWPGNVRELEHVIEGAMNLAYQERVITIEHLPLRFRTLKTNAFVSEPKRKVDKVETLKERLERVEKQYVEEVLQNESGNVSKAAEKLGMSRQSLQYRLKKYRESQDPHFVI
ncbi:sigma 54-interacting transcriptional regulator [Bacillus sp. CGMCC 1.16541]|uniref:sigma-54 interaction domain-containing protein n=1 Tax=Bacillus sp. CGMCC 1.16541 TaxID=2185143 RepID=UPI000D732ED6|nr:sigma 54-interacting transcriptional regulator [Bacillus sp. CGMCC 1.16541]